MKTPEQWRDEGGKTWEFATELIEAVREEFRQELSKEIERRAEDNDGLDRPRRILLRNEMNALASTVRNFGKAKP